MNRALRSRSLVCVTRNKGCASGEMLLEKILEEDSSYADESRSTSLHSDKHQLLSNGSSGHHHRIHNDYSGSVHVTNI